MLYGQGVGKSHSKIILIGEHAVVYGYPAIALPLKNIEVTCQIVPATKSWELFEADTLSMAVFVSLESLGLEGAKIRCQISSMIPEKRGMGSSAAVSIAAIRAVFDYFKKDLDASLLETLVNRAEMIAHMNPSGLDAKTCLSDRAIKFIRNVGFSELAIDLNAKLIIADTGIYGHTREAIQKVEENGQEALSHLRVIGQLTNQVEQAIAEKDLSGLGKALSACHRELASIGVSCPEADCLVETAENAGALGAKMSGGGLGGCIIALAEDEKKAKEIVERLREKGAKDIWIESL
ncbi:Mevalonate kinase [Streptococcus sp. DD10]|uniref:mevalonate kinase n=1 Tax=Streptococcus sp. DD10 TaxID=1777878 RepID=UPI000797A8D9|nr:mevalonate kinase [Streptococcus sp. DD10]KXT74781.1 Mevalonate kinase [Streptococcus sp. DD10]